MRCVLLLLGACFPLQRDITTVRGQVLYGDMALAGALVRLTARGSGDPTAARGVLTASNGEYRFRDVAPGEYGVFVTTDRWTAESQVTLVVEVGEAGSSYTHPTEQDQQLPVVQLTPAGAVEGDFDLTQAPSGSLEGVVVNLEGTAFQARADADGRFDFGRIPAGRYQASAFGASVVSAAPVVFLLEPEEAQRLRLRLVPAPVPTRTENAAPVVQPLVVTAVTGTTDVLVDTSLLSAGQIMRGASVRLYCPASDADGDALVYSWQVSGGVSKRIDDATIEWTAAAGAASLRCTVTDGQGAFATAATTLEVRDYRLSGAGLGATRAVFAQSDAGVPDFDLVVYTPGGGITRLPSPGQQTKPRIFGDTVVYKSDHEGSALNPLDIYGRLLPSGIETRLSSSNGTEVYDVGPAGIAVAENVSSCVIKLRTSLGSAPGTIYSTSAYCDRLIVGQTTLLVREAVPGSLQWRLVDIASGIAVNAPPDWDDAGIAAAFNGTAYVAALPSTGKVYRFTETFSGLIELGELPELSGTVTASVAARGVDAAWSAFDDGGLFGNVRGAGFEREVIEPTTVHGISATVLLLESGNSVHWVPR